MIDVVVTKGEGFNLCEILKIVFKYLGSGGISITYTTPHHLETNHQVTSTVENNDDVWIWPNLDACKYQRYPAAP
ncbi:hypothetical protein, partial [Bacillus cereus]|uniref:hypothetical protein n=1 Tax=Bacillus cereus TaxID=1396 RepID=UPI001A7EC3FC